MRNLIVSAAALLALTGCFHTTVKELPDDERLVSFVNDMPPPFAHTSIILAEDVTLWRASSVCPSGFKVTREAIDLGSYPHSYNVVVKCRVPIASVPMPPQTLETR